MDVYSVIKLGIVLSVECTVIGPTYSVNTHLGGTFQLVSLYIIFYLTVIGCTTLDVIQNQYNINN